MNELLEEKQRIEAHIKDAQARIEADRRNIHWYKKRLKLVNEQLKETPEAK